MNEHDHVHLREYVERILDEREKAVILTAKALEERLEHLNALRLEVVKIENSFVTKDSWEESRKSIIERVTKLENFQSRLLGVGIVYGLAAGVVGAIVGHVFSK